MNKARVEAFNAFNWFLLDNPNTTLSSATFGRITSSGDPRALAELLAGDVDVTKLSYHAYAYCARDYVLLDNLYCSGEVSQDGQPWTTSAYATDFTQRAWTLSYSKHGALITGGGISDPSTPYIWELARAHGRDHGAVFLSRSPERDSGHIQHLFERLRNRVRRLDRVAALERVVDPDRDAAFRRHVASDSRSHRLRHRRADRA